MEDQQVAMTVWFLTILPVRSKPGDRRQEGDKRQNTSTDKKLREKMRTSFSVERREAFHFAQF
ncbi:hypothetical protein Poly41_45410 [Novipirellula artificiosorum]|uniref:Uncharacterized protein n=1 Tax=Novipirellula artificiosorum TaxID=2528016 RepID=A0A5C6DB43_9BACT|nr:hypothetical protein Poly41_45410 [Novipirellula artificiosorum]